MTSHNKGSLLTCGKLNRGLQGHFCGEEKNGQDILTLPCLPSWVLDQQELAPNGSQGRLGKPQELGDHEVSPTWSIVWKQTSRRGSGALGKGRRDQRLNLICPSQNGVEPLCPSPEWVAKGACALTAPKRKVLSSLQTAVGSLPNPRSTSTFVVCVLHRYIAGRNFPHCLFCF